MERLIPVDEDLEDKALILISQGLVGLAQETDGGFTGISYDEYVYEAPNDTGKGPKQEISERQKIARRKAQQARAIVNRQRKRESLLPDYPFHTYVLYFLANTHRQPKDLPEILRQEQRGKTEATNPEQKYIAQKNY